MLIPGDWSAESGYRAGLELAVDPKVTAVFAANDQVALGALGAVSEAGCVFRRTSALWASTTSPRLCISFRR